MILPPQILIIDDHELFRSGLRLVLSTDLTDVQIYEASSIYEAIHNDQLVPTIVLLDIELNGLNGLDGIALIKRTWPLSAIVMLSSDTSSSTSQAALARGATAFVTKAETAKKILNIVHQIINQKSHVDTLEKFLAPAQHFLPESQLTARQYEVLDLLGKGLSNKLIARELGCAENTVRGHVQAILLFFNVASRSEAVYVAKQKGVIH